MGKTRRVAPGIGGDSKQESRDLSQEIALLRDLLHQVAALADQEDGLRDQVKLLNSVGQGCTRLASLLRAQDELGSRESVLDEINRVAEEIRARKVEGQ